MEESEASKSSNSNMVNRLSQAAQHKPRSPLFSCIHHPILFSNIGTGLLMRVTGPIFIITFYALLMIHIYAHFAVSLSVLKKRLGNLFGLLWVAIGAAIFYNLLYNHFFAMVVKPGSPKDLKVKYDTC